MRFARRFFALLDLGVTVVVFMSVDLDEMSLGHVQDSSRFNVPLVKVAHILVEIQNSISSNVGRES